MATTDTTGCISLTSKHDYQIFETTWAMFRFSYRKKECTLVQLLNASRQLNIKTNARKLKNYYVKQLDFIQLIKLFSEKKSHHYINEAWSVARYSLKLQNNALH